MSNSYDKSMLEKATSNNDEPTPAWMFHQMAKWTRDYSSCQKMEDFLIKKLESGKPHTIRKALIVLKQVAQQGDTQFSLNLTKKTEDIKKFTSYKGPQDLQYGDSLNAMIRQGASEAIQSIFQRTETRSAPSFDNSSMGNGGDSRIGGLPSKDPDSRQYNSMQGVSSTGVGSMTMPSQPSMGFNQFSGMSNSSMMGPNSSSFVSPNMSGGRMQGIGSPSAMASMPQQNSGQEQGYLQTIVTKATNLFQRDKYNNFNNDQSMKFMNFMSEDVSSTYQPPSDGMQKPMGGFFSHNDASQTPSNDWDIQKQAPPSSGIHEQKVVDEFCQVSAVQVVPTRQDLSQFATRCASVSSEIIAQKLDEKLAAPQNPWQIKLKALYAIEVLIKSKNDDVLHYFISNYRNIQAQTVAVQEKVAQRASKVLNLLHNKPDVAESHSKRKTPVVHHSASITRGLPIKKDDLLDMGGDEEPVEHTTGMSDFVKTQEHNNQRNGNDILADLMTAPNPSSNAALKDRPRTNSAAILDFFQPSTVPAVVSGQQGRANVVMQQVYIPVAVPTGIGMMQPMSIQSVGRPQAIGHFKQPTPTLAPSPSSSGFDFIKNQPIDPFDFAKDELKKK